MESKAAINAATRLIVAAEGIYLRPYLCPAAKATIGIGSTHYENGVAVTLADPPITEARAFALMAWELRTICLPAVDRYCPGQPDNVRAALADFVFNFGPGRLAGSTLRRRLNAGDLPGACAEVLKWNKGGGRVLPGLVRRRAAEAALMAQGFGRDLGEMGGGS